MNKIVNVTALPDGFLDVAFADGRQGMFNVKPFMASDYFAVLKNQHYFNQVSLFFSGVGWPDGQDLSPDTISAHLFVKEVVAN